MIKSLYVHILFHSLMDPPSRLNPDDNTNMQKIYNFFFASSDSFLFLPPKLHGLETFVPLEKSKSTTKSFGAWAIIYDAA